MRDKRTKGFPTNPRTTQPGAAEVRGVHGRSGPAPDAVSSTRNSAVSPRFAVCVENSDYEASLELHKIYPVVPDPDAAREGDLRIVDESGEDYLYDGKRFVAIELPKALERAVLEKAS